MSVDEIVERLMEEISDEADNTTKWSQETSIDIYQGIIDGCRTAIAAIREDMKWG